MKIKIRDLETPPDTSKGGILLPAPQRLELKQLQAIHALLRLARAAKVCHETTELVAYANPDNPDMQLGECDEELAAALAPFDFD